MKAASYSFVLTLLLKIWRVDNRMLPEPQTRKSTSTTTTTNIQEDEHETELPHHKIVAILEDSASKTKVSAAADVGDDMYSYDGRNTLFGKEEKCSILVMANQGHMNLHQTLLRKYRYNKAGDLIPSSVQYFIKFPQGPGPTLLVPLKDKAFSPSGGFIRYYKEVPPIPQSWRR